MNSMTNRRRFLQAGALTACTTGMASAAEPITRPHGKHFKLSLAAYSYRKYLAGDPKNNIPPTMTMEDFLNECAKFGLGASEPTSYYFSKEVLNGNQEDIHKYFTAFKRHAFLLGLDISGTAIGNTFTYNEDDPRRDEQLHHTKMWIDYAAAFGAPCIRIFAGNQQKDQSLDQAVKNCIETTKTACDYAAKKGVYLALENHGGIVARPEPLVKIVEAVESDWLGINLDGGNFHSEDPYKDLAMCAPYAVNVQVKVTMSGPDRKRYKADFGKIFDILDKSNYRGYIALEYEDKEEPKEAVPRYLEQLQKLIG